jgi:5-formyltetrahydrofolate cyclo-ligase
MNKDELRRQYKAIRLVMKPLEVEAKSRVICQRILAEIDFSKIKNVNVYQPIAKLKEVNPSDFVVAMKNKYPDIKIDFISQLKSSSPPAEKYDLIIVPVLAFDKDNNRLGWGGGWYDRFLSKQPRALKVGLGFNNGLVEDIIPSEPHDVKLDRIISEV